MFYPRYGFKPSPQKNRHNRLINPIKQNIALKNWTKFFAIGQGHIAEPLVYKFFQWGKKLIRYPQTLSRFWVNIRLSKLITKKPANMRMGKGKGGRAAMVAKVSPLSTLLAFSKLRPGLFRKIKRRIQVRCNFKVGGNIGFQAPLAVNAFKKPRYSYLITQYYDLRFFFRRTNQAHIYLFIGHLFYWFKFKPQIRTPSLLLTAIPVELTTKSFLSDRQKKKLWQFYWNDLFEDEAEFDISEDEDDSDEDDSDDEIFFYDNFDDLKDLNFSLTEWSSLIFKADERTLNSLFTVNDWALFFKHNHFLKNTPKTYVEELIQMRINKIFSYTFLFVFAVNKFDLENVLLNIDDDETDELLLETDESLE